MSSNNKDILYFRNEVKKFIEHEHAIHKSVPEHRRRVFEDLQRIADKDVRKHKGVFDKLKEKLGKDQAIVGIIHLTNSKI